MPLETAGGIIEAMPLLGNAPFLVVNADIYTDFTYASLLRKDVMPACGHLVLVQNPEHNREGISASSTIRCGRQANTVRQVVALWRAH